MIIRSLFLSLIAASAIASSALADTTIALINTQEIMHESTAAQSIKEQFDAKQKSFQSEMTKKEESLQKEDQDLGKERAVLSPEAFDKKVQEFKNKASAAQREAKEKNAELEKALSAAFGDIQKVLFDIVSDIAKEKGYSIVMPTGQLIYADPKLDITKDVLAKLNSKLPKVTMKFKASTQDKDE